MGIIYFLIKLMTGREYFMSVDCGNGKDKTCYIYGYRKNGIVYITNAEFE
jgi:hypothetical protein